MTITDDDRLWRDQNTPNVTDEDYEKIADVIGRNVNNNGRQTTDKNEKKPVIYTQKYSDGQTLAEAVLIGKEPWFLVSENGAITPRQQILDGDRVILPFTPEMYINKPYTFESANQVQRCIEETKNEKLDSLYRLVKSIWKKYIDADDFHLSICSADTIFTFFQDKIGLTHYLFFVGNAGSGKSNNLTVFQYLAYRNMTSTGLSYANIFQFLGSGEEGIGTICEDEADNIDEDPEKMRIYKNGYTTGRPTTKIDTSFGRKQLKFNNYCWKALAAERLADSMKAKGFLQRILEIPCVYGFPDYDISEVVNPAGDDEFQGLLDELLDARNKLLIYRLQHHHEKIPNIKVNLKNREKQLFKPVLRVFQNTSTLNELLPVVSEYVSQKRQANANTFHALLYNVVKELIDKANTYELKSSDIWDNVISNFEGKEITGKPLSYDTVEFGIISQKIITQIMKDVFGAVPPRHHGTLSKLTFNPQKFKKVGKGYELKIDVEIREVQSGEDGEDGDDVGSVGLDKHFKGDEE